MLGKIEGRRRRGLQRMRWLDGITDSMDMCLGLVLTQKKSHGFSLEINPSRKAHLAEGVTISSSVVPFSSLQSFPASGSFPMSQFFPSGGQSISASASASVLPMNIQE